MNKSLFRPILLIFCLLPMALCAQLSLQSATIVNSNFSYETFDVVAPGFVTNNFDQTVNVTWIRNIIELPDDWDTAVCDKTQCHFVSVGEAVFTLEAGETSNIDVHIYNWDSTPGTAQVEVDLIADISPLDTITATFIFDNALQTVERINENLRVYPNPTADFVIIDGEQRVDRIQVFDLGGKMVLSESLIGNQRLDMGNLSAGQYILRSFSGNQPVSVNVVSKK